jgi:hypothetical protein
MEIEINLVYCFSKLLSTDEKSFDIILHSLKKSISLNQKFHKLKLYTDTYTYKFVKNIDIEIEIINYLPFRFLDDIKIQTLPLLEKNDVLIDPDVFLYEKLKVDSDCDIFLERPEKITANWYIRNYNQSLPFKFSKMIYLQSKSGDVGNIGIIKFYNIEFMNEYISHYNLIKKTAEEELTKLPPFPSLSILIGQLGLQNLIDEKNYKVKYAKFTKGNKYIHLSGEQKYKSGYIDKLLDEKSVI